MTASPASKYREENVTMTTIAKTKKISTDIVCAKIRTCLDRAPWATTYGVFALIYGHTQDDVQILAAVGALVCSRFILRRVYKQRANKENTQLTQWVFAWKLFVAWGAIASALYALYLTRG